MENSNVFNYCYSAAQNREVESIRKKYLPKEESKLDMLRKLDAQVRRPANIFAYVFGGIAAIIMGAGMSLVMTDIAETLGIANSMPIGITVGVAGLICALVNCPIYKKILASRKKKYAGEILELSEKIMNN